MNVSTEEKPVVILNLRDECLMVHYLMLTRQVTHLADCLFHIVRLATQKDGTHGSKKLDYKGWKAYSQSELSDVLVQVWKLCRILDIDYEETFKMGMQRDAEKRILYEKTHPGDKWV
jgi:hypothetical protein